MGDEMNVYLTAMQDALRNKYDVLKNILDATQRQEAILLEEELDIDAFDGLMEVKEELIQQMQEFDQGFQSVYDRIKGDLEQNKQQYKPRILEMQNQLRQITDMGVKIQALEQKNKTKFEVQLAKRRQQIQEFRINHKTANVYTQHMANQHQEGQSYFLDKKK